VDVAEADVAQRLELPADARLVANTPQASSTVRSSTSAIERPRNRTSSVSRLKRLPLHTSHGHEHVGQEVHLDLDQPVALARLAAAALHVEREAPRPVAADLGLGHLREQLADGREEPGVRGRVGARRAPDGALVDVDDLVDVLEARDRSCRPG
jgi:hypothetical protein